MGRAPCCDKANVKKGPWSTEEDTKLKSYIEQHGTGGNWIALPQKIGLKRCGKSCRLRWLNYLRPNLRHGGFSEEEDNIICSLYISIGSRWSIIAAQLPGRTDNDIKNYWNTRLKKKLLGKQRKDHQQVARRLGGPKQEARRGVSGDPAVGGHGGGPTMYWPEPTVPIHMISPADQRIDEEQAAIKKLLIKLGGRFSTDDGTSDHQRAFNVAPPVTQQPMYDEALMQTGSFMNSGLHGPAGFTTELDEMFDCNPVKLEGLDCLYGAGSLIEEGNGTSTSWNEVSPLMYPPVASDYQGMQQCLFEDPVHLGIE